VLRSLLGQLSVQIHQLGLSVERRPQLLLRIELDDDIAALDVRAGTDEGGDDQCEARLSRKAWHQHRRGSTGFNGA
jgi:hypothetical protein